MDYSSESDLSDSDRVLQEAFVTGKLKPGLNAVQKKTKKYTNNVEGLKHKLEEIRLNIPWVERLDCASAEAALAPELAAQILEHEQNRGNKLKNNRKLPQFKPSEDPVLNDFKREMSFHRQAQATVLGAIPKLKELGVPTTRPDDYFAEMAKSDEHMQKIREHLMQKQQQQQRSERVKQLRQQKKEGKMLQIQSKLQRQQDKKELLDQVKKYRKGVSKNLDFLESKMTKAISRKALEKRKFKNKKFGLGGKKKGSKMNTKESAADIAEYRKPNHPKNQSAGKQKRLGKNRRIKSKNKK